MTLAESAKDRLKEMLNAVKQAAQCEFFVLIVDDETVSTISSIMAMSEITDYGVALVENIAKPRQPLPNLDAAYFITPYSAAYAIQDFATDSPVYRSAHLFFVAQIPGSVIVKLAEENISNYIMNLSEVGLDFYIKEPCVFTFRMHGLFKRLYAHDQPMQNNDYFAVAYRLSQVCMCLKELPNVVYQTNSSNAQQVAGFFQTQIEDMYRKVNDVIPSNTPATLLILDRAFDPISPLMHDFYYEAWVYDLLSVHKGAIVEYQSVNTAQEQTTKQAQLNDKDEMWMKYKYMHIADLATRVKDDSNLFLQEKQHIAKGQHQIGQSNIQEMSKLVMDLPEYEDQLRKFAVHTHLVDSCLNIFNQLQLKEIAELEQMITTGVDENGSEAGVKKINERLQYLMSKQPGLRLKDRSRLLLLYSLCISMSDSDRRAFMSRITTEEANLISNLEFFGVQFIGQKTSKKLDKATISAAKQQAKSANHILTRHEYKLQEILESACRSQFDPAKYTVLRGDINSAGAHKTEAVSMRKKGNTAPPVHMSSSNKLIVMVIGGVCYSELRVAKMVSQANGVAITIGGTEILSPGHYVDQIESTRPMHAAPMPMADTDDVVLNLR